MAAAPVFILRHGHVLGERMGARANLLQKCMRSRERKGS